MLVSVGSLLLLALHRPPPTALRGLVAGRAGRSHRESSGVE
jgi:hypothetical protein